MELSSVKSQRRPLMNNVPKNHLTHIREGMTVVDRNNDQVGKVDYVQFGDEDPSRPGAETRTVDTSGDQPDSIINNLAEALVSGDEIPEALRARFSRYGYIKIEKGMFASDRYV